MQRNAFTFLFPIILFASVLTACTDDDDINVTDPNDTENVQINKNVDHYLRENYLWNDEYKTLSPDFDVEYTDFLNNTLLSLTTNTLDKKADANGNYSLYSYIEKHNGASTGNDAQTNGLSNNSSSAGSLNGLSAKSDNLVAKTDKELTYSFGITGLTAVSIMSRTDSTVTVYFCVQGVYPGSSAANQGITRGAMIKAVGGTALTSKNNIDFFYAIMRPGEATTLTLTYDYLVGSKLDGHATVTVNSAATYCNPIIYNKVVTSGNHKIGYLVYSNFDAGYNEELYNVFADFKSQGVTDLILDLRYNRGGRTSAANLMGACIAGSATEGKVFNSMRYNDTRMAKRGNKRDDVTFYYPNCSDIGQNITAGALDLKKLYVLTGNATASASELVINSLRGIDIDVILVGDTTEGKNVGMEYEDIKTTYGNTYRLYPITFQTYNAKGESNYEHGFAPDVYLEETNPYNQEHVFYLPREYGSDKEPLYAKAIELITGVNQMTAKANRAPAASNFIQGSPLPLPQIERAGHYGTIK